MTSLPSDFRDRPKLQRYWINFLVLIGRQKIKIVCCDSYRVEGKMRACKGCPRIYNQNASGWFYRFLARVGKKKVL
ncbi:hypothetical protein COX00_03830 [Candidatus Uhrbacteria bacterium CG22_combo_CG10-13_8_21_14_all_47_17]|uniref:Uncharacterized protein n=1 Tax=Candidatus Uhrbacteria bacterium CG22_combo_CG10-13_8_21_14_all_47_17 TaxID=1975041 RepID=A0A2H0BTE0_9BACT|nr:MAG: hypothetical protein COX00_03830 [Candidatus Uhrbacteria bacterium CG22_combo_CG10-13_8_21_14_all_47_17]